MKNIKFLLLIAMLSSMACSKIIDLQPLDQISAPNVWKEKNLVESYLAEIYAGVDFAEIRNDPQAYIGYFTVDVLGGECRTFGQKIDYVLAQNVIEANSVQGTRLDYWKYDLVRNCNVLIEKMQGNEYFAEEYAAGKIAEARFLRAYIYFQMAIRFGALPIIDKVIMPDASDEEIYPKRDSEQAVYDFIIRECEELISLLPEDAEKGRPTKWAAYALQSRVALYAASIAAFGEVQQDGLLGISISKKEHYAEISYNASRALLDCGRFSLYRKYENPAKNYYNLFLDESAENCEVIMVELFDYSKNKAHAVTQRNMPHDFSNTFGSAYFLYDFIELFEFEDGRPGTSISRQEVESREWTMEELFGHREPRFQASVFYPECEWQGGHVHLHTATIRNGKKLTEGVAEDGWPYAAHPRNYQRSGFMVRKKCNESIVMPSMVINDDTDCIIFRLGEVYLNLAEAAFYLERNEEALNALNEIRNRAGLPGRMEIDMEDIIHERMIELNFENQSYWDIRRWRVAKRWLDGKRFVGLDYVFNYDTGKFKVKVKNQDGKERNFAERNYYLPLGNQRVAENPNFVENPGY